MNRWVLSVDLGQTIDPTGIAALEVRPPRAKPRAQYTEDGRAISRDTSRNTWPISRDTSRNTWPEFIDVRHLERLPLRMPYPDQIAYVASLLRRPPLVGAELVVDQTGVGRAVVDFFRRAGLRPLAITITGGDTEEQVDGTLDEWHVAKLRLVSRLQALLHAGELRIAPQLRDAKTLASELSDFRGVFTETGYARFGAREGAHDDLVLAVALGCWAACKPARAWGHAGWSF